MSLSWFRNVLDSVFPSSQLACHHTRGRLQACPRSLEEKPCFQTGGELQHVRMPVILKVWEHFRKCLLMFLGLRVTHCLFCFAFNFKESPIMRNKEVLSRCWANITWLIPKATGLFSLFLRGARNTEGLEGVPDIVQCCFSGSYLFARPPELAVCTVLLVSPGLN